MQRVHDHIRTAVTHFGYKNAVTRFTGQQIARAETVINTIFIYDQPRCLSDEVGYLLAAGLAQLGRARGM